MYSLTRGMLEASEGKLEVRFRLWGKRGEINRDIICMVECDVALTHDGNTKGREGG
jgi:hypothetical protein